VAFPRNVPVEAERKNTGKTNLALSGKETAKTLTKVGTVPLRQKSSHVSLRHVDSRRTAAPLHEEVNIVMLMVIIERAKSAGQESLQLIK
jgi:predicted RNA binding protein YcfA (HicA-like mRNA interferase family)